MAWRQRLRNVLRPGRLQRDLDRELSFHIAERAGELRDGGMTEKAAFAAARRQFGNYTAQVERTREMDINVWLEALAKNLRLGARGLRRSPGFAVAVVATLALGIGANSAVFSAIDAVLLRPLPFPEPDRLVSIEQVQPNLPDPFVAPSRLEDWNRLNSTFQSISGYDTEDESELSGDLPEMLRCAIVAPRFLEVWGVAPTIGRDFDPQEEHFGGPGAILISDRLWRRRFAADPNVLGKKLHFRRRGPETAVPIIGVLPPSFVFPERSIDLWIVGQPDAPWAQDRTSTWYTVIGRLKPGVSLPQARTNLAAVQAGLGRQFPRTDARISLKVTLLKESAVGGVQRSLWMLFGSVTVLLLIACTNVTALLLSRGVRRQQELTVRFSLGASRQAVAAQLLTEILFLAILGAALGLSLAAGASRVFRSLAADLPRVEEIGLDWRIVVYSLVCAVGVTLICGVLPVLRGTRRDLAGALAQAGRSQVAGRNRVQLTLVGVQVALAVGLLAGAGLLLRSFQALGRVAPGFDPSNVLTLHVTGSWGESNDPVSANQTTLRILEAIRATPGVEAAAAAYDLPGVPSQYPLEFKPVEGRAASEPRMIAESRPTSSGYFDTLRIPLLEGSGCRDGSRPTGALVNQSFVNAYWRGQTVIGRRLARMTDSFFPEVEVRGIVGDARETGLDRAPGPTVYWCFSAMQPGIQFLARTHGDPMKLAEPIRRRLREVEPARSVYGVAPLTERISIGYTENRLRTILLSFFAVTAVLLACIGLYGTLSYLVSVRQREVGLRLALGAVRMQIVRQFLMQGLRTAMLGCVAGLGIAVACARLLKGMLYGVSATDTATLAGVIGVVLGVSAAASLLPAVRAARLEPMQVLRNE
ncbi:MAG TPA: ABC transporter permease [Verrucomicrobiae bacterium]|nr:ABC transporter permease [Verrucomicrobiae bacterium]